VSSLTREGEARGRGKRGERREERGLEVYLTIIVRLGRKANVR